MLRPLLLGPLLFIICLIAFPSVGLNQNDAITLATVCWMVYWWVAGVVPIPVTALLPIAIFPVSGVATLPEVTSSYAHPLVFLFLGGFILAAAIEKCHLHKRIALHIIHHLGHKKSGILLGFMLATALISMWISNTATTMLMLPIALSLLKTLEEEELGATSGNFAILLMLGVAYSANIGGIATLIGTPPNAILAAFLDKNYGVEIGFGQWMLFAFPLMMVMLLLCYYILPMIYKIDTRQATDNAMSSTVAEELKQLGPLSKAEKIVMTVFSLTALSWILRRQLNDGLVAIGTYFEFEQIGKLTDSSIAIIASIILFCIPLNIKEKKFVMDWNSAAQIPWGILLLFGGGLTMASMMGKTSIINDMNIYLAGINEGLPLIVTIGLMIGLMLFLTELMSNMALTSLLLPVIAGVAISMGENPLLLCIPVTMAASFAFMMPVATPPNAIIFSSGKVTVPQMMRAGLVLNLLSITLLTILAYTVMLYAFDIDLGTVPEKFLQSLSNE